MSLRFHMYFLCCFFLLLAIKTKAQSYGADTLTVFTIGQEQGLSQLNALALDFDDQGYLWTGTENGLNRYNAHEMVTFMAEDKKGGLIDDHIRDLYYDKDTLWLATNTHALSAYLVKTNRFIDFDDQLDYTENPGIRYTNVLYPINSQQVILGAYSSCLLYNKTEKRFSIFPLPVRSQNDFVTSISALNAVTLLIGTNHSGLFKLNLKEQKISSSPELTFFKDSQINAIHAFSKTKFLIATAGPLYVYDLLTKKIQPLTLGDIPVDGITSIQKWDEEKLFLATSNFGYFLYKDFQLEKVIFQDLHNQELSAEVTQIKKDDQGGTWLATKGRGLFYFHPHFKKFFPYRITAKNTPRKDFISIFNFLRESDTLWMATEFGFAHYNFKTQTYKFYPEGFLEYTLAKDQNGNLWGGGFGQGLVKYNRKKDSFDPVTTSIGDKDIIQITPVGQDSIWIHTWSNGIFSMNIHNFEVKKKAIQPERLVRSRTSYVDSRNRIWIGSDEGLYKIEDHIVTPFLNLSNKRVFAITEDLSGNIWVGTAKGLNRIDHQTEEIRAYTMDHGLPNNFIYGVETDQQGHIWSSTNYGLSELDPVTEQFRNFTENDGLQNNEFNGKAAYKDKNGYLYFGGMNGFNFFNPKDIFINQKVGKTLIEDVLLFGKSIGANLPYTEELVFSHYENVISFTYATLNFLWPDKNHYQFKLEGFDKEWRTESNYNSTTYTNLDPGDYVFRVKGANNDGVWGVESTMKIVIKAPWYESFWFRTLVEFLILAGIVGFFLYKNDQQKRQNKRLTKMVQVKTKALQKSNQELNDSLDLSEKRRENIAFLMRELSHRVKNNLQIITSLIDIQDLSISDIQAKEKLNLLQKRVFTVSRIHDILARTKEREVIRMDLFLEELAREIIAFSGKPIALKVSPSTIVYPTEKLTYLGLILNELITNSIKHAFEHQAQPEIELHLEEKPEFLQFLYKDNGKGFTFSTHNNAEKMGIQLIHFLAKEVSGVLKFTNANGALFCMKFAKITQNYGKENFDLGG